MYTTRIIGTLLAMSTTVLPLYSVAAEDPAKFAGYDVKFTPRLDFTGTHTDNILKTPDKTSDTFADFLLSGNLNLNSEKRTITSDVGFKSTQHYEVETEELDDYYAAASVLQHFTENFLVYGSLRFEDSTLTRHDLIENDVDGRTDVETTTGNISSSYTLNKMQYTLGLDHVETDILDTSRSGVIVNKDDEDRVETDLSLKGNYNLNDVFQPSFTLSYGEIDYEQQVDDFGLERSSHVTELLVGGRLVFGSRVSVQGEVGRYLRDYQGVSFSNLSATIGNGSIQVQATEKLTGYGTYSRSFSELNIDRSPGIFVDVYTAGFNYSATGKLAIDGSVTKMFSDLDLTSVKVEDTTSKVGFSYVLNASYNGGLHYTYSRRTSNTPSVMAPYTENAVVLNFSATF